MDKPRCPRRIHVLGLGSIGLLIAHSLMRVAEPPIVTLLLHRPALLDKFNAKNSIRVVTKKTGHADDRSGFRLEVLERDEVKNIPHWRKFGEKIDPTPSSSAEILETGEEVIQDLVVACKGPATISAIQSVKHRINSKSTICLMQNGMGQVDELNQTVFTRPEERPTYVLGIMSHGLYLADTFTAVHAGLGTIALGIVRDLKASTPTPPKSSTEEFLQTLTEAPAIGCSVFEYQELLRLQLEKLTVNCILNPLTALLDVHNGQMLNNTNLSQVHNSMISEISAVIRALPELKEASDIETRFSNQSLTDRFAKVTELTATNSSSMREDVRGLKDTEIDYINGYIIRRGKELGVNCSTNELVMHLIKGKTQASRVEQQLA